MIRTVPLAAVLLLVSSAPAMAATAKTVDGPVAVMQFKNLNEDASLGWLQLGIAETMVTDLKKSGRLVVVERDQVEQALSEILRQGASGAEEASAVKAGKMVGAKTVVLGSFQQAGKELRINARFVAVETGVILDTAKETGPATQVFALQDKIVDRLLGVPQGNPAPARPKRPAASGKTLKSYELYAKSLASKTDTERAELLKASIAAEPGFTYAIEDLAALEERMAAYARISRAKFAEKDAKTLAVLEDTAAAAADRTNAAFTLIASLMAARRYATMVDAATRIISLKLAPNAGGYDPAEYASAQRVFGLKELRKWDLALQHGEKHLKEYPGSQTFSSVEATMDGIISQRRIWAKRKAEFDEDVADKREDLKGKTLTPEQQAEWDYAPCIAATWNSQQNELMLDGCGAFLEKHAKNPVADPEQLVHARFSVVSALASLGRFDEARPLAEALLADSDEWDEQLKMMQKSWPVD